MSKLNDPFALTDAQSLSDPGDDIYPVTPDDNIPLPVSARALRANVGGVVQVKMRNGQVRQLNFADGETRIGRFIQVYSTNTTASGIEAHI